MENNKKELIKIIIIALVAVAILNIFASVWKTEAKWINIENLEQENLKEIELKEQLIKELEKRIAEIDLKVKGIKENNDLEQDKYKQTVARSPKFTLRNSYLKKWYNTRRVERFKLRQPGNIADKAMSRVIYWWDWTKALRLFKK